MPLCNPVAVVFFSLCIPLVPLIMKQLHWWGTVECCLLLLPKKQKNSPHTFCMNFFLSFPRSGADDCCVAYFYFAPYIISAFGNGSCCFFSRCVEIVSMPSWHNLALLTIPVFACNPNPMVPQCIKYLPILLWKCVFFQVLFKWCACSLSADFTPTVFTAKLNCIGHYSCFHNPGTNLLW